MAATPLHFQFHRSFSHKNVIKELTREARPLGRVAVHLLSPLINIEDREYSGFINGYFLKVVRSLLDNECKEPWTSCMSGAL